MLFFFKWVVEPLPREAALAADLITATPKVVKKCQKNSQEIAFSKWMDPFLTYAWNLCVRTTAMTCLLEPTSQDHLHIRRLHLVRPPPALRGSLY